jgi:hypothetical protein
MKQLPAEACPLRSYSQRIFSPYGAYMQLQSFSRVPYFVLGIFSCGKYCKEGEGEGDGEFVRSREE